MEGSTIKPRESLEKLGEKRYRFPIRPGQPDCAYYLKTNTCAYGSNCKFNHPPIGDLGSKGVHSAPPDEIQGSTMLQEDSVEVALSSQRTLEGGFKNLRVNEELIPGSFHCQLPVRNGEPDCTYYLKTGTCAYGSECKFNHPSASARRDQGAWGFPLEMTQGSMKTQEDNTKPVLSSQHSLDGGLQNLKISEDPRLDDEHFHFPVRPGEPDCSYYLKTGTCAYGTHCKFNHPFSGSGMNQPKVDEEKVIKECPERMEQMECKYYLTPGGCKYGKNCKYGHYHEKAEVEDVELNFLGLPIRPREKECPHYLRTGCCKFSANCCFHHPEPVAVATREPVSVYQNGGYPEENASGESQSSMASTPQECASSTSYIPRVLLPHQRLYTNTDISECQVEASRSSPPKRNVRQILASAVNGSTRRADDHIHEQLGAEEYPERPGQPECRYFAKHGKCGFKLSCKFHHPKAHSAGISLSNLSPVGLPMRPDQPICSYYDRYGICKYGPSCKFDHPVSFGRKSSTTEWQSSVNIKERRRENW